MKKQNLSKPFLILFIMSSILICNLASALAAGDPGVPTIANFQARVLNKITNYPISNKLIEINISSQNDCSSGAFFVHNYTGGNLSGGYIAINMGSYYPLNLSYNNDYYLCLWLNNEKIGTGPFRFRGGQGQINSSEINPRDSYNMTNLNLTNNLFAKGLSYFKDNIEMQDNLTVGDNLNITSDLIVNKSKFIVDANRGNVNITSGNLNLGSNDIYQMDDILSMDDLYLDDGSILWRNTSGQTKFTFTYSTADQEWFIRETLVDNWFKIKLGGNISMGALPIMTVSYASNMVDIDSNADISNNLTIHDQLNVTSDLFINKTKFAVDSSKGFVGIGIATPHEALHVVGNANISADLKVNYTIIGTGNNIRIGNAGTDSHSLTADDDLFVSGKLEVDGLAYFDSAALIPDEIQLQFGNTAGDAIIQYDTTQTPDSLFIGVSSDSRAIIIADKADEDYDFAHAVQTNPTIFINSKRKSATEWMSLAYSDNDTGYFEGIINTGKGPVKVLTNLTAHNTFVAEADIQQGDIYNIPLFNRTINGTHIIFEAVQGQEFTFTIGNVSIVNNLNVAGRLTTNNLNVTGVTFSEGNVNITGNLGVGGDVYLKNLNISGLTISEGNVRVDQDLKVNYTIIGAGNNIRIGNAGTDSNSLTADDDLFVSGKLEVDGLAYFDSAAQFDVGIDMDDDDYIYLGTSDDVQIEWETTQTTDALFIGLGAGNTVIIGEKGDIAYNFAHVSQTNPTMFFSSATQSTVQWGSLSHDTNNFQIDAGGLAKGNKKGAIANNTEIASRLDVNQEAYFGANTTIGDVVSDLDLFTLDVNGTNVIFNSPQKLEYVFKNANVTIDSNQLLQLNANTTPVTCDTNAAGSIHFNGSHFLGCDGTSWNPFT